jgi:hypothetical protein
MVWYVRGDLGWTRIGILTGNRCVDIVSHFPRTLLLRQDKTRFWSVTICRIVKSSERASDLSMQKEEYPSQEIDSVPQGQPSTKIKKGGTGVPVCRSQEGGNVGDQRGKS